jgi:hypothetical protein
MCPNMYLSIVNVSLHFGLIAAVLATRDMNSKSRHWKTNVLATRSPHDTWPFEQICYHQ